MKEYPEILSASKLKNPVQQNGYWFEKLDGSNLRFEFNRKRGWVKFGSRNRLLSPNDPDFGGAMELFQKTYPDLPERVRRVYTKFDNFVAFAEFFGPVSFAGQHDPAKFGAASNDPKQVVLFDIAVHKHGFMSPERFLSVTDGLPRPRLLHEGTVTEDKILAIRRGDWGVNEGVVVKGGVGHRMWMIKIKTDDFMRRVREHEGRLRINLHQDA